MQTATINPVKVGDAMLFVNGYGARPVVVNVSKITKTGQIRFTHPNGTESELFKSIGDKYERANRGVGNQRYASIYVYPLSEEKSNELNAIADECEKDKADEQAERQRKNAERDARIATETEEAKAAMGGDYNPFIRHHEALEDDSRVFLFAVPVKVELAKRKGKTELVMIRIKDVTDKWMIEDSGPQVECWITYANKASYSFPSCSGFKANTDDEAIWEAIRYVRNSR